MPHTAMTTTAATHTEQRIQDRLQDHAQELHHLLADVRHRALPHEEAQVRDAITCLAGGQLLPARPGSFPALAQARQRCLRDVCRLRESARPALTSAKRPLRPRRLGIFSRLFPRPAKAA